MYLLSSEFSLDIICRSQSEQAKVRAEQLSYFLGRTRLAKAVVQFLIEERSLSVRTGSIHLLPSYLHRQHIQEETGEVLYALPCV